MVHHDDTASQRSLSAMSSGSVCSSECLPRGLNQDLASKTGVNLDGCSDTHVGPRINFNIVLNGNEEDTRRALQPMNRIIDRQVLSGPNVFRNPTIGDIDDKAVPSAPYEPDESLPDEFRDELPPKGKAQWKPRRTFALVTCVAVLLAGGAGGIYACVKWSHSSNSSASNGTTLAPPTSTPSSTTPGPTSSPSNPNSTPSSPTPGPSNPTSTPSTPAVVSVVPSSTNPTLTPSPFTPSNATKVTQTVSVRTSRPTEPPWPSPPAPNPHTVTETVYLETITPEPTTPLSPSISHPPTVTASRTPVISPETVSPVPVSSPSTSDPSYSGLIYKDWGQLTPDKNPRTEQDMFDTVALDNLPGKRCAAKDECARLLKRKAESGESLNYNFLIDDSGNLYYARGTGWMANKKFNVARVAFIGSYNGTTDAHLMDAQIQMLRRLIIGSPGEFKIDDDPSLEAQCILNIEGQPGPDKNVICDIEAKLQEITIYTVNAEGNGICGWGPERLDCKSRG